MKPFHCNKKIHANFYWLWVVPLVLAFVLTSRSATAHFLECLDRATLGFCCDYEGCYDLVHEVALKCSGNYYPVDCCNAYGSLAQCQNARCLQCDRSYDPFSYVADCGLTAAFATKAAIWCNAPCMEIESVHHEGCNNEVLCSCVDEWRDAKWLCKFNDFECLCPIFNAYIDCIQPEVEACGNEGLDEAYGIIVQQRDEICALVQEPSPKTTTTTATQEEATTLVPPEPTTTPMMTTTTTQEPPTKTTTMTTTKQEAPTTTKTTTTTVL